MIALPIACASIGAILPFTPLGGRCSDSPSLPIAFFLILLGMIAAYIVLVEFVKARFYAAQDHQARRPTQEERHHRQSAGAPGDTRARPPAAIAGRRRADGASLCMAARPSELNRRAPAPREVARTRWAQASVRSRRSRKTSARRVAAAPMPSIAHAASGRKGCDRHKADVVERRQPERPVRSADHGAEELPDERRHNEAVRDE